MRHAISLAISVIVLSVGSLTASPVFPATQCTAYPGAILITNPTDILFLNPTWTAPGFQCEQSDKLFSDFTTVGVPSDVTMRLTLQGTPGNDIHTVNFAGDLGTAFTIGFTVTVDPAAIEKTVKVSADLSNPGHMGNPSMTKTVVELAPGVFTGSTTASFLGGPGSPVMVIPPAASLRVTDVYTPNGGAATEFGNAFFQTSVPEPATTALFGAGLLALAFISRRRTTKNLRRG